MNPAPPAAPQKSQSTDDVEVVGLMNQLSMLSGEEAGSTSGEASTNDEGPAGIVPLTKGPNASIGTTSQHDAAAGWTSFLTPNVAYRFNRHFSFNAGLPVYTYIITSQTENVTNRTGAVTGQTTTYLRKFGALGDVTMDGEFEAHPRLFDFNFSVTMGAPTGDYIDGLSAGKYTYFVNDHFERSITDWLNPDIEIGIGNNSSLVDARIRKSYTDLGSNAHFQAGLGFSLPFDATFTTDAYEELPLSTQTVTSTTTNGKKGKQLKLVTTKSQKSLGEDNGFLNTLDIPLNGHVTLSGFYNRSLRDHDDTAGFSLTFLLRSSRPGKKTQH